MRAEFIAILLVILVLFAGCVKSPRETSQETQAVFENASSTIKEYLPGDTYVPSTFAPLTTSAEYRIERSSAPVITPTNSPEDPIIGRWVLAGQSGYSCYVAANIDGTGRADCNSFLIPIASRTFRWVNTGDGDQSFITTYNITEDNSNAYYSAQYSSGTDRLYSTMLPANVYLVRS